MLESGARRPANNQGDLLADLRAQTVFQLQQLLLGSIWQKIAVYFVIGPPLVVAGGTLLLATGGEGFYDGIVSTYASLYKVPSNILTSSNTAEVVVLNIMCTCTHGIDTPCYLRRRVYGHHILWRPPRFPERGDFRQGQAGS